MILLGKPVADAIMQQCLLDVAACREKTVVPALAVIRVGNREDDLAYERGILKRAEGFGISVKVHVLDECVPVDKLTALVTTLNQDPSVHGILLFRPLPAHLEPYREQIESCVSPEKDVDAMTESSAAGVYLNSGTGFAPCTAEACLELLHHYGIGVDGKRVAVIGRSAVIGKPVSLMLLNENATVTICHTHTKDIASITGQSDIIVSCAGKAGSLTADMVKDGQIILDVSVNASENGICGDMATECLEKDISYTPVPRGIGSITSAVLMKHVVKACMLSIHEG